MAYRDPHLVHIYNQTYYAKHRDKILAQKKVLRDIKRAENPPLSTPLSPGQKQAQRREKRREYRAANREKINAYKRAQRMLRREEDLAKKHADYCANREVRLAKQRSYAAQHRAQERARAKAWREANPERATATIAQWRQEHPEQYAAIIAHKNASRRALKAGVAVNDFTTAQWEIMKQVYGHRCVYCGRKMQRLTMDHITPLSKGENHTASNIVPACQSCNSKKKDRNPPVPVQPLLFVCQ